MLAIHRTEVELFRGCSRRDLAAIDRFTTPTAVPAGFVLCREGAVGLQAFLIVSGEAIVTIGTAEVARLGPGAFVGEMALLQRGFRSATVTTVSPVELLAMSIGDFDSLLTGAPGLVRRMLIDMSSRLRLAQQPEGARRRSA